MDYYIHQPFSYTLEVSPSSPIACTLGTATIGSSHFSQKTCCESPRCYNTLQGSAVHSEGHLGCLSSQLHTFCLSTDLIMSSLCPLQVSPPGLPKLSLSPYLSIVLGVTLSVIFCLAAGLCRRYAQSQAPDLVHSTLHCSHDLTQLPHTPPSHFHTHLSAISTHTCQLQDHRHQGAPSHASVRPGAWSAVY